MFTFPFTYYSETEAYEALGVEFDGTNDFLTKSSGLTGASDSKLFSGSFWFKKITVATNQVILHFDEYGDGPDFRTSDEIRIHAFDTTGTPALKINTTGDSDTDSWHHCMWSVDMADTGKRHLYLDDVSDLTVVDYEDQILDFTQTSWTIGARNDGSRPVGACMADLWLAPAQYIDLSVESKRRKFISSLGFPVNLGLNGSRPTGVAPLLFFSGETVNWHTNKGSGGGFTEQGALTDCATSPSDE